MACKPPIIFDEPVPPLYQFGETVNEPIHILTTTPTRTLTDIQFDHISINFLKYEYDTIEEALCNRHRVKCCERDYDSDGNCDIHRAGRQS